MQHIQLKILQEIAEDITTLAYDDSNENIILPMKIILPDGRSFSISIEDTTTCKDLIAKTNALNTDEIEELGSESCMIHTSHLDPSSDFINVLVLRKTHSKFLLSDFGYSFSYLRDGGTEISPKLIQKIEELVRQIGGEFSNNEVILETEISTFSVSLQKFVHSLQKIMNELNWSLVKLA